MITPQRYAGAVQGILSTFVRRGAACLSWAKQVSAESDQSLDIQSWEIGIGPDSKYCPVDDSRMLPRQTPQRPTGNTKTPIFDDDQGGLDKI